ncbi:MAG: type II secretion system protein, partial [Synergistaceae bacterium]|nr:type II secretion system protein [Synergistaceae bacterium]
MGNRRNGFTLVELLTAIVVMTIISGAAMMSLTAADQTAKREAERVQAYIYDLMRKADRAHVNFTMKLYGNGNNLIVTWNNGNTTVVEDASFFLTDGCYFEKNLEQKYSFMNKGFSGGTILIIGADGKKWKVILAVSNQEGRIRIEEA